MGDDAPKPDRLTEAIRNAYKLRRLTPEEAQALYAGSLPESVSESEIARLVARATMPDVLSDELGLAEETAQPESAAILNRNLGETEDQVEELLRKQREEALSDEEDGEADTRTSGEDAPDPAGGDSS